MAASFRSHGGNSVFGVSCAVSWSAATVASTSTLVAIVSTFNGNPTAPTGWTQVRNETHDGYIWTVFTWQGAPVRTSETFAAAVADSIGVVLVEIAGAATATLDGTPGHGNGTPSANSLSIAQTTNSAATDIALLAVNPSPAVAPAALHGTGWTAIADSLGTANSFCVAGNVSVTTGNHVNAATVSWTDTSTATFGEYLSLLFTVAPGTGGPAPVAVAPPTIVPAGSGGGGGGTPPPGPSPFAIRATGAHSSAFGTTCAATWSAATIGDGTSSLVAIVSTFNVYPTAPSGWTTAFQGINSGYRWSVFTYPHAPARTGTETFTTSVSDSIGVVIAEIMGAINLVVDATPSMGNGTPASNALAVPASPTSHGTDIALLAVNPTPATNPHLMGGGSWTTLADTATGSNPFMAASAMTLGTGATVPAATVAWTDTATATFADWLDVLLTATPPVVLVDEWTNVGPPTFPNLSVQIDFDNDPTLTTRTWTDVTTDIRSLSYTRAGRSDPLQQTSTGTLSMLLDNTRGDYDPLHVAGAHYPKVKRMRWIRVRAYWAGVAYDRWRGLITSWEPDWPASGQDATCAVTAADALKVLSLYDLSGNDFAAQRTDQRVAAICTLVGLPFTATTGLSTVVDTGTLSPSSYALSHLQQVEDTENGRLFADPGGTIRFQDRHYRQTHSLTASGTIGDLPGEIRYDQSPLTLDDSNLWNSIAVTPSGGTAELAGDAISQGSYYTRALSKDLLTASQVEARAAATYLLRLYRDPAPKLPALQLRPLRDPTVWPTVLAAGNSDQLTFLRRPVYGGTIVMNGYIEQISENILPGQAWDVTMQLSAVGDQVMWVLGDAAYGLLGETTILGY